MDGLVSAHFALETDNAKALYSLLTSIHSMKKDQMVTLSVEATGVQASVEDVARTVYAVAYLNVRLQLVKVTHDKLCARLLRRKTLLRLTNSQNRRVIITIKYDAVTCCVNSLLVLVMQIKFRVSLSKLLDCLAVFGVALLPLTRVNMSYSEADGILHLLLEAAGVTTECDLRTAPCDGAAAQDSADDVFRYVRACTSGFR